METNIPLTTKKVPISRTCPRLFGSFVGSPWTLNRYRSTGCYLFHLFLLHERLAGLALNCFEIPGFLSLQLVLHFLHLLQFSLNLEWQGYSMVTIASRNLILVASSLEAEIKMNQDESMSQMPNNMDLLGIRHQNLETTPSQNRFHCLRHSFGKGIVDLDIGHSTHRFLPGAIYAMLGNSRWNQLQPSKFVVTDVTELG